MSKPVGQTSGRRSENIEVLGPSTGSSGSEWERVLSRVSTYRMSSWEEGKKPVLYLTQRLFLGRPTVAHQPFTPVTLLSHSRFRGSPYTSTPLDSVRDFSKEDGTGHGRRRDEFKKEAVSQNPARVRTSCPARFFEGDAPLTRSRTVRVATRA